MAYGLTRRSLLRALGTTAVALPVLELTQHHAKGQASAKPKRLVVMYAGLSQSCTNTDNLMQPATLGADYELTRALASLGASDTMYGQPGYDVREQTTIVSNLKIPWGPNGQIPPGGKSIEFHYNSGSPQVTGIRRGPHRQDGELGTSVDLLVADQIGRESAHHSLMYRVQAARYSGSASDGGLDALNTRKNADGSIEHYDSVVSPRLAYQSLFSGFVKPDSSNNTLALQKQAQRRGILALIRERTQSVLPRLGRWDQLRMERHFDELSALEGRLEGIPEPGSAGACSAPTEVGEDPAIGDGTGERIGNGWSGETVRGNTMCDLITSAFACDLTRVASMRLTLDQTRLGAKTPLGEALAFHQLTHSPTKTDSLNDALSWHAGFFGKLTAQLRDTMDVDGTPILDSTAIVLLFEGGSGFDPESSRRRSPHSTENMVALVSGGMFGQGVHIDAQEAHPAQIFTSVLPEFGLLDTLGEIEGSIDGLVR